MLSKYRKRMDEAIEYLGGKCKCGSTHKLELDHIDPTTKSFAVAKRWSVSKEIFWAEVKKCQLLCIPCHITKHHGTVAQ